ncbi:MAG: hypothetical protein AAF702_06110 [Chloroflexota bacterium]
MHMKRIAIISTFFALVFIGTIIGMQINYAQAQDDEQPEQEEQSTTGQVENLLAELDKVQSLDQLPPYILLVAQRTVPSAQFSGFQWDLSDNLSPLYELQGIQDNKQLEIGIFLDGSINRINRTITMSDVPVDVIGMLDKYVRDFEVSSVNEATLASGVHRFEFAGRSGAIDLAVEISDSANQIRIVELQ